MGTENTSAGQYIAILEDDDLLRKALARLIAAHSFPVQTFGAAGEFFDSMERQSPFCLILDFNLPDMTGLAVLGRLRGDSGLRIPTIVMTGHDDPQVRYHCEVAGVLAFLVKPASGNVLIEIIESVASGERRSDCNQPDRQKRRIRHKVAS